MGIIPVPDSYGNDCTICFPAGKTPDLLKVFYSGIEFGDDWVPADGMPPNGYYDHIQIPASPCSFSNPAPHPTGWVIFGPAGTDCTSESSGGAGAFWGVSFDRCTRYFFNRYRRPLDNEFWGGYAFICTPLELETWLNLVTPTTGPDPRLECYPMANGEIVLKFCNIQDGTNIKIKLDTALL